MTHHCHLEFLALYQSTVATYDSSMSIPNLWDTFEEIWNIPGRSQWPSWCYQWEERTSGI